MAGCFNTRRLHYILPAILLLASFPSFAQRGAVQSHSYIGGTKATVSGLNSTNYMNGIIPAATITVYLTGTTTKASIYSDASGTVLSNPFTSNSASSVDPGGWIFFAATNQGLDVVMSGGNGNPSCNTAPLCYTQPVTLTDVFPTGGAGNFCALAGCTFTGPISGTSATFSGNVKANSVSGNVNGVYAVTTYGAVGDCTGSGSTTGCTDNHTAIQAAIDAAYAVGGSVYFPTNPSASSQTVYYTSVAINPKGVSMYGPPGGSGASNTAANQLPVAVRGAPGKDVFNVPDPTTSGWIAPKETFTVRDLAIIVDDSTNASSSFPHRFPGRHCFDVSANGTTTITSSAQCEFQPGDVGQNIAVNGTTTTITAVSSMASIGFYTQATLGASVASGSSLTAYISVMGLSTTQTVGNCGFAYDAKDFTASYGSAPLKAEFYDVVINTTDNSQSSYTCGYFFQGEMGPYQTRWQFGYVGGYFGYVYAPADTVASSSQQAGLGDFNVWDHIWIGAPYSFVSYGGGFNQIQQVQIAFAHYGPQILDGYNITAVPNKWTIDLPEIEINGADACAASDIAFRLAGMNHIVKRLSTPFCASGTSSVQWDANESVAQSISLASSTNSGTFNVAGGRNIINIPSPSFNFSTYLNVTGEGNQVVTGPLFPYNNNLDGIPSRLRYGGGTQTSVGPPQSARGAIAFNRTHDFIDKGAAAYYLNGEDLWLWPTEMGNDVGGGPTLITDSTSETGSAYTQPGGFDTQNLVESNGTYWAVGTQIPAGKMRIYFKAKAASNGSSFYFQPQVNESGTWTSIVTDGTACGVSLTTSYQVFHCDADATGLTGDNFRISSVNGLTSITATVAWGAIRPWESEAPIATLQVGMPSGSASNSLTGQHGTGANIQTSDGTGTSGNIAKYSANGSVVDGGVAASSIVTAGSPTVGNAACVKSLGPPIVFGYCSTVVSSSGTCTCN